MNVGGGYINNVPPTPPTHNFLMSIYIGAVDKGNKRMVRITGRGKDEPNLQAVTYIGAVDKGNISFKKSPIPAVKDFLFTTAPPFAASRDACQLTAGCFRKPGGCDICEGGRLSISGVSGGGGGPKCILCAATAGQWNSSTDSCAKECYNATFLFSGNCKKACPEGWLQTTTMQKACVGVTHYASKCTGHQLGPIGIFKELECTKHDFRLDNIDIRSLNRPQCGVHKCFYRSRHEPGVGYVVVPYGRGGSSLDDEHITDVHWLLTESYSYATRLATTYHIRHGLVGPPLIMDLPKLFADQLSKARNSMKKEHKELWSNGTADPFRCGKRFWSYLVQRVQATPANACIVKPGDLKIHSNKSHNTCNKASNRGINLELFIRRQNNETLLRTLQKDLFAVTNMMAGELGLVRDFQMMFVPDTGHLLQMDLDRGSRVAREGNDWQYSKRVRDMHSQQTMGVSFNDLLEKLKQRLVEIKQDNGV